MSISHHLDDATLLAFAAGTPDEAVRIVVASHLAFCCECRRKLNTAEQLGAVLLDEIAPEKLDPDAYNIVLARIDEVKAGGCENVEKPEIVPVPEDGTPRPLARHLARHLNCTMESVPWKRVAPGISVCALPLSEAATGTLRLICVTAGKKVPEHSHSGEETTLVLHGQFTDDFGTYGPGDISELAGDMQHSPMIGGDQDCICLVAVNGPLRFTGTIPRILQPFTGL
jgi:putative transcriptional regulator